MADFNSNSNSSSSAAIERATSNSTQVTEANNYPSLNNLENLGSNLPLDQEAALNWQPSADNPPVSRSETATHPSIDTQPVSKNETAPNNSNEAIAPLPSVQDEQREKLAYNQALSEKITQENRAREQAEIAAAREEIQVAQKQVHHLANASAASSIDNAVEIFAADEKKGIFNRGIFSAISFFTAYHRKEAQRKRVQHQSGKAHPNTPTYTERDQEQQQNSQNLG